MKPAVRTHAVTLNLRRRYLYLLAAAILAITAATPLARAQATVEPARSSSDDPALNLARRLLGPWGDSGGVTVEIVPQRIPVGLPIELPLPDEFSLLGSLANYGADGQLLHAQIVLDSPIRPDETGRLLERSFSAAGWTVQEQGGPMGFVPANAHVAALYCAPQNLAFIQMNSFGTAEGLTDVRLELNTQTMYSPCGESVRMLDHQPPQVPLPALAAPEGSQVTLHGGNYLEDQASSSAVINTDLPPDELLRHFESQLEQAGWTAATGVESGQRVWLLESSEGSWRGVLAITDLGSSRLLYYASFVMVSGH